MENTHLGIFRKAKIVVLIAPNIVLSILLFEVCLILVEVDASGCNRLGSSLTAPLNFKSELQPTLVKQPQN